MKQSLRLENTLPGCQILLVGHQLPKPDCKEKITEAFSLTNELGAQPERITQVKFANDASAPGFQCIAWAASTQRTVQADGIVLPEWDQGAFGYTGDCPALILSNPAQDRVALVHCGRWAMSPPTACGGCASNVLTNAFQQLGAREEPTCVHAYITGGICGDCFPHETKQHQAYIAPFRHRFGETIFTDVARGCLDLVQLIRYQLIGLGVPEEQITHDELCTRETVGLASHRAGDRSRNLICVVNC